MMLEQIPKLYYQTTQPFRKSWNWARFQCTILRARTYWLCKAISIIRKGEPDYSQYVGSAAALALSTKGDRYFMVAYMATMRKVEKAQRKRFEDNFLYATLDVEEIVGHMNAMDRARGKAPITTFNAKMEAYKALHEDKLECKGMNSKEAKAHQSGLLKKSRKTLKLWGLK